MPASQEEVNAQIVELRKIQSLNLPVRLPKTHILNNRIEALNLSASPGPSGMRNPLIKAIAAARGGSSALARYVAMWRASKVCRATAALWTSAIITPIDCNVIPFEDFTLALSLLAPQLP